MSTETKIDCEYTDEAVCPHCGSKRSESYEWFRYTHSECVEVDCGNYGQPFIVRQHIRVKYSSHKKGQP